MGTGEAAAGAAAHVDTNRRRNAMRSGLLIARFALAFGLFGMIPGIATAAPALVVTPICSAPGQPTIYQVRGSGFPGVTVILVQAFTPDGTALGGRVQGGTDPQGNFRVVSDFPQGQALDDFLLRAWVDTNGNLAPDADEVQAAVTIRVPCAPTSKDQCKDGGYKNFIDPSTGQPFKNQGQCIQLVNAE
jgi:hypothetical protein